jgi:hypothetical protein
MTKRIKNLFMVLVVVLTFGAAIPALATSTTVYYNGTPVAWEYGRSILVNSYSKVQSSEYEHLATANTTSSGWQKKTVLASAEQFVGTGTATAYWNCR